MQPHKRNAVVMGLLLEHIQGLGVCLNYKKSKLQPSSFLGMVLNSRSVTIVLTPERQQAFKACLNGFQLLSQVDWGTKK